MPATASPSRVRSTALGLALTLVSTVAFSWLGVLTQLGYAGGATVGSVLSGRFLVAAALLWCFVLVTRPRRPDRRQVVGALLLGLGYGVHAQLSSESLARLDAGLVDVLFFTYPVIVTLGAIALGRDRMSERPLVAVVAATVGVAVALVGGLGIIDPAGAGLALGAAVSYSAYILVSAGQLERTDPLVLAALVSTSGAVALTFAGALRNDLSIEFEGSGLVAIVAVGAVAAIGMTTFLAGVGVLGPSRASIVSAAQPALTPIAGFLVFADRLGPVQVLSILLVVASIVILEVGQPESESFLALLPRRERRALLRAAAAFDVPAGNRILSEGNRADRFYLITRGHAMVTRGTRSIAALGPGDCFGEVALVLGGARTASVEAVTDMSLRAVSRHDFAERVESLPTLAAAVDRLAAERLAVAH